MKKVPQSVVLRAAVLQAVAAVLRAAVQAQQPIRPHPQVTDRKNLY